jgi:uncharacterized protein YoxC
MDNKIAKENQITEVAKSIDCMSESIKTLIDDAADFTANLYENHEYDMDEMIERIQDAASSISMDSEYVQSFYQTLHSLATHVTEEQTTAIVKKMFLDQFAAPFIALIFKDASQKEHKTVTFHMINAFIMDIVDVLPPMLAIYFGQLALSAWLPLSEERKRMRDELSKELIATLKLDGTGKRKKNS